MANGDAAVVKTVSTAAMDHAAVVAPTRVRHTVLWLTVAAYMITYIDRVVISAAVPSIQEEFGFSIVTMGWILGAYQLSYALFQIPGGWLGDRFGPRRALPAIVAWWSAFTAATALTWSATSMIVCRFLFGMGEAGAFPIATRSLSRWMLPSERGFAQGITHAGSRLGGALTPIVVVFIIAHYGWRAPFYAFAVLGLVWAAIWYWFYRDSPNEHRMVNAAERELIASALGNTANRSKIVPWRRILRSPQMWLLSAMYFCYGYDIGIFLTWFPKYLHAERQFELQQMGIYASLPLLAGVAGDICGGWFSDLALKRTGNLKFARRVVAIPGFLIAAVTIPLACLATRSAGQRRLFRARRVRYRVDRRCFLGGDAGHRRSLCRLGVGGDEHVRQSGRGHCGGDDRLHRDRERLDHRVLRACRLFVAGCRYCSRASMLRNASTRTLRCLKHARVDRGKDD